MSRFEIVEHARYLGDGVKIAAYDEALSHVVKPTSRVLDLGAGTGLLGLLAARRGAAAVYSVDRGSIAHTAAAIAAHNGLDNCITVLQESSWNVTLPEPVDVVVCDQIGGMVYDAGILENFHDVRQRLAAPDAVLIPGSFDLLVAPVDTHFWDEAVGIWERGSANIAVDPMFEVAANTEFRPYLDAADFLCGAACWGHIAADSVESVRGSVTVTVERPGTVKGVAGMFVAQMGVGVTLTNCPLLPNSFHRWQNFYPIRQPVEVGVGDHIEIHLDLRPALRLVNWRVDIQPATADEPTSSQRGSTALSGFLTPDDLTSSRRTRIPLLSERVAAERTALGLVDGRRSLGDIVDLVWAQHPDAFATLRDLERRIQLLMGDDTVQEKMWHLSPMG